MHRKDRCVSVGEERALVRPLRLTAVSSAHECEHVRWHRGLASSNSQPPTHPLELLHYFDQHGISRSQ